MPRLQIVITSTRPQRAGEAIARWFVERAEAHGQFELDLVDLLAIDLPMMDEPNHPMQREYTHDHTKAWSARVASADAFVFVIPEYNYAMPPAMLNALDYLYAEWNYKAAGFVSYGGASGGMRAVQFAKQVLTSVKIMPIPEMVALPFAIKQIDANGKFDPGEAPQGPATKMLDELARWTTALNTMRAG